MSRVLLGFIVLAAIFGFWGVSSYNKLVRLALTAQSQWSQVETVKGAAKFEKETFTAVTEARAKVNQVQGNTSPNDPASFNQTRGAQDQLTAALTRLMVVVEHYPDLN